MLPNVINKKLHPIQVYERKETIQNRMCYIKLANVLILEALLNKD